MPIREIAKRASIPIKGHIRLGVRVDTAKGTSYPQTVEHFVLKDAPDVQRVYGDDPKELDICFPGNDIDKVLPTWYKYWTSSIKDANGVIKKGSLVCWGDGPDGDEPGMATWRDKIRLPADGILSERDPNTGCIKRACWGKSCSDSKDAKGYPKCKQTMQVYCFLPKVSWGDIYVISTSSWTSIRSFHELLIWNQKVYGQDYIVGPSIDPSGNIRAGSVYKLVREETELEYRDNQGKDKKSKQFIMMLREHNREHYLIENKEVLQRVVGKLQIGAPTMLALPSEEEALQLPMEDIYPTIEANVVSQSAVAEGVRAEEALLLDPEIQAAFKALGDAKGTVFSDKAKRQSILKKASSPNIKAAVLEEISMAIAACKPVEAKHVGATEVAKEYEKAKEENDLSFNELDMTIDVPNVVSENTLIKESGVPGA